MIVKAYTTTNVISLSSLKSRLMNARFFFIWKLVKTAILMFNKRKIAITKVVIIENWQKMKIFLRSRIIYQVKSLIIAQDFQFTLKLHDCKKISEIFSQAHNIESFLQTTLKTSREQHWKFFASMTWLI